MFKLNDKIFNTFKEFIKRFSRLEKEVGKEVGINNSEAKVISYLSANEQLTHTELGKLCNADKAAMSRLLNKLETDKIIKSDHSESNKKNLYSKLTEQGKKLAEKIKSAFEEKKARYFAKLSQAEAEILMALFNKMFAKA